MTALRRYGWLTTQRLSIEQVIYIIEHLLTLRRLSVYQGKQQNLRQGGGDIVPGWRQHFNLSHLPSLEGRKKPAPHNEFST